MAENNRKVYIVTNDDMDILGVYSNLEAAQACIADDPDIRQFTVAPLQSEYDSSYEDDTALTSIKDEVDEESLEGLISDVADEIDEEDDEADELDFDKGPRARRDPYGD